MADKKVFYPIVLTTGKSKRKMLRYIEKQARKGVLTSPLGKLRSRQERKAIAETLKIKFNPRYNGPVYQIIRELVEDKKGRLKVQIKDVKEVK